MPSLAPLIDAATRAYRLDQALGSVTEHGSILDIESILHAGAKINGIHTPPIIVAAETGDAKKVMLFLRRGALVDAGVVEGTPSASSRFRLGTRALHRAVECGGHLEVARALLNAGANPNVTDCEGWTPLMILCAADIDVDADIVAALLEVGADPSISDAFALLTAAAKGRDQVVSMLLSTRPDMLNTQAKPGSDGATALCMAAGSGKASTVSLLLSAGARQPASTVGGTASPLRVAAKGGHCDVIRVLLDQGLEAIGGAEKIGPTLTAAVSAGRARVLHLLLGVGGDEERAVWASSRFFTDRRPLLHSAVSGGTTLATISVILAGGARETTRDAKGRLPRQVIGSRIEKGEIITRCMKSAIARMLERGPAFRARSWLWPSAAGAGSGVLIRNRDNLKISSVVPADSTDANLEPSPPARPPNLGVVVRIFRPTGGKLGFTTIESFARYPRKL